MTDKSKDGFFETWGVYRRLLSYLRPYRARFFVSLLAMGVYGATDGAIPWILKRVLDDIFGAQDRSKLYLLVGVILFFAVVRGLFGFLQRYYSATVGNGIVEDVRNDIAAKLLELSPGFYSRETSGSLLSRMTNDVLLVRSALTDAAKAIKEVLKLTEDVKRAGEALKDISRELREHDRRITRLEAKWDTAMQLSATRPLPPTDRA